MIAVILESALSLYKRRKVIKNFAIATQPCTKSKYDETKQSLWRKILC